MCQKSYQSPRQPGNAARDENQSAAGDWRKATGGDIGQFRQLNHLIRPSFTLGCFLSIQLPRCVSFFQCWAGDAFVRLSGHLWQPERLASFHLSRGRQLAQRKQICTGPTRCLPVDWIQSAGSHTFEWLNSRSELNGKFNAKSKLLDRDPSFGATARFPR